MVIRKEHIMGAIVTLIAILFLIAYAVAGKFSYDNYVKFRKIETAVKDCATVTVDNLTVAPLKECSETNPSAIIAYKFGSMHVRGGDISIVGAGDEGVRKVWEGQ
ncbi:MAG: hypothetical protein Q8M92_08005 [Candidatus Subteraquimicrobiales bacterium]|nr:hypothetical protein [Candidatus Subteraquimicrobiales bacterium]